MSGGISMTTMVYDGVLMWPVACFWKTCGVLLTDLSYNRFGTWFSAAMLASCALNVVMAPWSVCVVDGWCDDSLSTTYRRLYTRTMACMSLASRAAVVYKMRSYASEYKRREDAYERNWPLSEPRRRLFRTYASAAVTACLVLMFPMNLMRLYVLCTRDMHRGGLALPLFFFNVYMQNWSMCCMETHFVLMCFMAYLKFLAINDELSAVRADVMVSNRYPAALRSAAEKSPSSSRVGGRRCDTAPTAVDPAATAPSVLQDPHGRPLETAIETLRFRHGLTRESVDQLNNVFSVQLTLSLIALCLMTLVDVYNEAFYVVGTISKSKFGYGWILQYVFRFFMIIITAHNTTQEGYKTKVLVTEINNRHLNDNTKYELQLFLKQMNHQSIDITAFDCFTLNSRLVASVIAVGTTYLFVLIQFREEIS